MFLLSLLFRLSAQRASTSTPGVVPAEAPLDILKRRYANGELSKDADVGPAKTVDGLLSVTDDEQATIADAGKRRNAARLARLGPRPQQLNEVALHARRILELIDEQCVDSAADLIGDVGTIPEQLASRAKNFAESDGGAGATRGFDFGFRRTEDVSNDGGMASKLVANAEGARDAAPLFVVGGSPESLAEHRERLELGGLLASGRDPAERHGGSLDRGLVGALPSGDQVTCCGLELWHHVKRPRMFDERAERVFQSSGVAAWECQVARGSPIFFELDEHPPQLNDQPLDAPCGLRQRTNDIRRGTQLDLQRPRDRLVGTGTSVGLGRELEPWPEPQLDSVCANNPRCEAV